MISLQNFNGSHNKWQKQSYFFQIRVYFICVRDSSYRIGECVAQVRSCSFSSKRMYSIIAVLIIFCSLLNEKQFKSIPISFGKERIPNLTSYMLRIDKYLIQLQLDALKVEFIRQSLLVSGN
ncbi:Hypothetical_protein [Hexamita inflata]|uniref:Hypothetical_protein n=1 Tax=Hexamita inflata TaxID=28002 RepID=A0AA86R5M5_9EUKA|nr:Hypothetical protein HINF_LOCUS59541 [Hexamita inflata]